MPIDDESINKARAFHSIHCFLVVLVFSNFLLNLVNLGVVWRIKPFITRKTDISSHLISKLDYILLS